MQASRLLSIMLRLQAQGQVTAQALAEMLEVSVRTIYRDIDALSAAGVPVYAEKGRQGGFALLASYRTRLTGPDRPEAQSLFLAGAPFAAEQLGLGQALANTRFKLLAALPDTAREEAERVAARFHLDPVAWFQGPDRQGLLPQLAAAVWQQRMLQLGYESWKGRVERRVAPLGLVLKGGLWYLVAAHGEQARSYRVAAIEALTIEDEAATPLPDFDLQQYWQDFCKDHEARMQSSHATVRARPAALRRMARLGQRMAEAVAAAGAPDKAGWRRLQIPIESIEIAAGELLRLGPDVEALGPPALLDALRQRLAALHECYGLALQES
ncbi:YafY family transcriptional regulator [Pelomonas sp. V22]|uniref:helix-turn-helix transcriptional regulator n=1 Tax=Pelomonas sp. V22 TaxID=2822139 RepID=UPI0024A96522|nr:YafY family protein [Pelomonas sp. V22]MDI4635340.1 YafY family transcriptional regulator [Pelomonas sp. V22]